MLGDFWCCSFTGFSDCGNAAHCWCCSCCGVTVWFIGPFSATGAVSPGCLEEIADCGADGCDEAEATGFLKFLDEVCGTDKGVSLTGEVGDMRFFAPAPCFVLFFFKNPPRLGIRSMSKCKVRRDYEVCA